MANSPLARHAGPIALTAGAAFALVDLARWDLERPGGVIGMMADPAFSESRSAWPSPRWASH